MEINNCNLLNPIISFLERFTDELTIKNKKCSRVENIFKEENIILNTSGNKRVIFMKNSKIIITNTEHLKVRMLVINGKSLLLSNREYQCLKLLAHGKRTKDIARLLEISNRTVEGYLNILKRKLETCYHGYPVEFYWSYVEPKIITI